MIGAGNLTAKVLASIRRTPGRFREVSAGEETGHARTGTAAVAERRNPVTSADIHDDVGGQKPPPVYARVAGASFRRAAMSPTGKVPDPRPLEALRGPKACGLAAGDNTAPACGPHGEDRRRRLPVDVDIHPLTVLWHKVQTEESSSDC